MNNGNEPIEYRPHSVNVGTEGEPNYPGFNNVTGIIVITILCAVGVGAVIAGLSAIF